MQTIRDVIQSIEAFAPLALQADFDNSGLQIGNPAEKAEGVLISLDLTPGVAAEAAEYGCNLILTHHPVFFHPVRSLAESDYSGRAVMAAVRANCSVYAAHTNIDFVRGGLNDRLLEILGVQNIAEIKDGDPASGRIGDLPAPVTLAEFVKIVQKALPCGQPAFVGDETKRIRRVAAVNGSGGSEECLTNAFLRGADVFVSSEFKYHVLRLAKEAGYAIIDAGHYATERAFMPLIAERIRLSGYAGKIRIAESCRDPFER